MNHNLFLPDFFFPPLTIRVVRVPVIKILYNCSSLACMFLWHGQKLTGELQSSCAAVKPGALTVPEKQHRNILLALQPHLEEY